MGSHRLFVISFGLWWVAPLGIPDRFASFCVLVVCFYFRVNLGYGSMQALIDGSIVRLIFHTSLRGGFGLVGS